VRVLVLSLCLTVGGCAPGDALRAIQVAQDLVQLATLPARTAKAVNELQRCGTADGRACSARPELTPYLRGTVVVSGPVGLEAVPFVEIALLRQGRTVATAATDRGGVFGFVAQVPTGDYELVVDSGWVQGARSLLVDGPAHDLLLMAAVTP
jgi:hypothetical protein